MITRRRPLRLSAKFSRIATDVKLGKGVQLYDFQDCWSLLRPPVLLTLHLRN